PGEQIINKPIVMHKKILAEKEQQIQQFLANRTNVIMSLYKTDSITNKPVFYLKYSKDIF
ncbi:35939_t:CDS:1, partial [Racocetra persica]